MQCSLCWLASRQTASLELVVASDWALVHNQKIHLGKRIQTNSTASLMAIQRQSVQLAQDVTRIGVDQQGFPSVSSRDRPGHVMGGRLIHRQLKVHVAARPPTVFGTVANLPNHLR